MALINFSGIASGIDSTALIEALLGQQRETRVKPLETKIAEFSDTNTVLEELTSLLTKLQTAAGKFREVNGSALSKVATSTNESVVTAAAGNAATNGTHTLTVTQLAKNATFSFNDRFSGTSSTIYSGMNDGASEANRTVTVNIGTGGNQETVGVVLTSTSTVNDFVNQFNSTASKATASAVNVGTSSSPSYAIMISSNEEGLDEGQVSVSVGSAITNGGAGAFNASTTSQALNSQFTVSGISGTITQSSNTVSGVIQGVTFSLQNTGTATISVSDDSAGTTATVQEFVDAYNDVVNFITENDLISQEDENGETTPVFGALSGTSLDESILGTLRSAISGASISGGSINLFADLGITTERDGTLSFDENVFKDALADEPESVRSITQNFGESVAAVDGSIAEFIKFGGLIDLAVQSNESQITTLQRRIADIEDLLSAQEQSLTSRFSKLEGLIGQLTSQQSALSSVLANL